MNKELYQIWKRFVSLILTICLIVGLGSSHLAMVAYASTELPNENLGNGASEGTAYAWIGPKSGTGETGNSSYRFDLCGLQAGQTGYSTSGIKTTFSWQGYATYIQVDNGNKYKANGTANGAVEDLTNMGIELKIALSPSPDNKYVFVDYYVYDKTGQGGTAGRSVKLGTGTDVMIGGSREDDYATVYKNNRGFHMVNQYVKTTFDCITNDSSLDVTPPTTRWIGHYSNWGNNVFNEGGGDSLSGTDSGMAYSWHFQLHPYEMVHKRVAFAIRDTSYYVSGSGVDSTAADGTYSSPFKTIEYAMGQIGNKKGYIYIMDYPDITAPIPVSGSSKDITIASTDYDRNGNPTNEDADYIKTLRRAGSYTGPIFEVTGATLKLTDLVLDGSGNIGSDPLVSAGSGRVEINSGAELKNCHGDSSSQGSALNITGSAALSMNYGKVSGNLSEGKGAVYFNSTGRFDVLNDVMVEDNTTPSGAKANIYLETGRTITVTGDLDASRIGVTTAQQPAASPGGISTEAGQEIKIAVPLSGSGVDTAPSPFADNFFADQAKADGTGVYVSVGTRNLPGAGTGNDKNAVIKRNGLQISFVVKDAQTGGSIPGVTPIPPVSKGSGEPVDLAPGPAITGYELSNVVIEQGTPPSLTADLTPGSADFGRITGTMPNQDVAVNYEYQKVGSQIIFNSNGGTPEPETLVGTAGNPVNSLLPTTTRYGYIFKGWSPVNDWDHPQIIDRLPAVYPETPITYYAIFEADPSVKFNYTVEHSNVSGDIMFDTNTMDSAYSVEEPILEEKKTVRGYTWSQDDSSTTPSEYNFSGTSVPIGQFNGAGTFTGKMPGQDATIRYSYKVRYDDPNARSLFEVLHETNNGTTVSAAQSGLYYPENEITAQPAQVYGYECTGYRFDLGDEAGELADGLVNGVRGDFDESFMFSGIMPNQPVRLVYLYESSIQGYGITVKYEDNGTADSRLKDIIPPENSGPYAADSDVEGVYQEQYGYSLESHTVRPADSQIQFGGNDWSGIMPNDDVTITYKHDRIPALWGDITYKPGANGTLQGGSSVSQDVQALSGGRFKASVLLDDGSPAGREQSYTLASIKERRLMPETRPVNNYYRFGGWFIDTDGNGIMDNGETILPQDYRFTAPATITAYFEENPDAWINISFAAGSHGSIDAGQPLTLRTTFDKKWGDIAASLPSYTPEVNYLVDDWYVQGEPVDDDMDLVNGQTYTIQFYPDPAIFGTEVTDPEPAAGLNSQGKGRITVFGTTQGYKYILTDLDGKVLAVNKGNILTSRTVFDNLYPGMRYLVYEATGQTTVQAGNMIGDVEGTLSNGVEVLTPVVDTNYKILYDEEDEGKTRLIIRPADLASDYAVLDSNGHVVTTPQTGAGGWQGVSGNPGSVSFSGLDYNKEYTVVARPKGQSAVTAESCREDGSVITTDPGGDLELPAYIIETLNGEVVSVGDEAVGEDRYEEAHKGDLVKIKAEAVNDENRPFSHWKFIIGSVEGMENRINSREASFTMPDTNLVLTAVYERAATPSNATVVDEVRGGSREEVALDPGEIPILEDELTTDADRELLDVNHADVTYKVVYRKNSVRASESNAIKMGGSYDTDHEAAYKAAWGLDVSIERYVNGRKVNRASASEASFNTYVQLGRQDVDMMDYQLYEISGDPDTEMVVSLVPMDYEPEETGGLFTFTATEGRRYIMVYNRAYRVYFLNNTAPDIYRYWFKVRREESPADSYYESEYGGLEEQLDYFISPAGAEYSYLGWSYRQDRYREFEPDRKITRKTYVYAYYDNNEKELDDVRKELEEAIREAIGISDDHFLKLGESKKLKEYIEAALEVLDREEPKATIDQLEEALRELKDKTAPYKELLDGRYDHYDDLQESGNKGGSKGGGGGGGGSKRAPFAGTAPLSYQIGTNGNWVESTGPSGERQLSFVLNGGTRLSGMWAKLHYPEGTRPDDSGWYYFDDKGIMQSGWIRDMAGNWYYCNTETELPYGKMLTGWRLDTGDGNWYYLDPASGVMAQGWRKIDGKWYYFSTVGAGVYAYDPASQRWTYGGGAGRPLGAMYRNEITPDGYQTDADGAWIQ